MHTVYTHSDKEANKNLLVRDLDSGFRLLSSTGLELKSIQRRQGPRWSVAGNLCWRPKDCDQLAAESVAASSGQPEDRTVCAPLPFSAIPFPSQQTVESLERQALAGLAK